jgi:hypothetical protein
MKYINLYQAEFRPPKIILPARLLAGISLLFLTGILAFYAWGNWQLKLLKQQVTVAVQRADAVSRQVAASAPGSRQADPNIAMDAASIEARVNALQVAQEAIAGGELGTETGYSTHFRALARTAVTGTWLTHITISNNGRAMDLQGNTLSGSDAARFIANLRSEPLFIGMSFAGLNIGPLGSTAGSTPGLAQTPDKSRSSNKNTATASALPAFLSFSLSGQLTDAGTNAATASGGGLLDMAKSVTQAGVQHLANVASAGHQQSAQAAAAAAAAGKMGISP